MKRFQLKRNDDVTGVSGTGLIVEGVQFEDGSCSIRWFGKMTSWTTHLCIENVVRIHGHDGATELVWIDKS